MDKHVFISYQRTDQKIAEQLASAIFSHGLPVFIDLSIRAGNLWDDALENALHDSFAVVPIWTTSSVQSRWVKIEARYGLRIGRFCPTLCENCNIPLEFSDVEYADLRNWQNGEQDHLEWHNLISSLQGLQKSVCQAQANPEAELSFRLGIRFLEGNNVPMNISIAREWLLKAEDQGHQEARKVLDWISRSSNS